MRRRKCLSCFLRLAMGVSRLSFQPPNNPDMNPPASKVRSAFILAWSVVSLFTITNAARAADNVWIGGTSPDWNTPSNWSLGTVPTNPDNAVVNSTPANVATITANLSQTPRDIIVGINGGNTGRLFHVSGTATTGNGNWLAIGVIGGTGTYNLTNATPTGGNISGFGQGSGTVTTSDRIIVGEQGGTGTLNINTTGGASSSGDIHVGFGAGSSGTANIASGTLTTNAQMSVGEAGGTGILNINTATATNGVSSTSDFRVGIGAGSNGTVNLASGTLNAGNSGWALIGTAGGTATFNVTGGTVHIARETLVGSDANTVASLNIRGGTYSTGETGNLTAYIGRAGGTGNLNVADTTITGGTATGMGTGSGSFSENGELVIGVDSGSLGTARINTTGTVTSTGNIRIGENFGGGSGTGRWYMDNGTVNAGGQTWIGNNGGNGTMIMSGGTFNAPDWISVGRNGGTGVLTINGTAVVQKTNTNGSLEITNAGSTTASGTVNLDGGTLLVNQITGAGGVGSTSILNFNGGTLKPTIDNADFINGNVVAFVKAGGAVIDTNGKIITINQSLTGDAANRLLTKNGTGTLTLGGSGDNASLGATVNVGTFILGKTSSGSVHALGGATTVAGGTMQLGGTGNDQIWTGVTVTVDSGTFDLNGRNEGFNALSGSGGTVTNTNATTSRVTVGESNGSGSYAGNIVNGTGTLALTKNGAGTQALTGTNMFGSAAIDGSGATNVNGGIFAISAGTTSGTPLLVHNATVNINGGAFSNASWISVGQVGTDNATMNVSSGSITTSGDFNVSDVGTSTGALNVSGTGLVSANGPSLYIAKTSGTTGTVNLDGGTISTNHVGGAAGVPNSPALGNSTFNFNGGTLQARTSDSVFMQNLTRANVRNGGAIIDTNGFNVVVDQALLHSNIGGDNSTDGGLTKRGAGRLTLTGSNTFTGATTIATNGDTLAAGAAGALGGTSSVTVNAGGTLLLQGSNNVDRINNAAAVTLAGGGVFNTGGLNEGPADGAESFPAAMGALTLSANSTIDFTSGTGSNLLFASLNYTQGNVVSILHWTGMIRADNGSTSNDRLLFTTPPGFSDAQLASIQFSNDSGTPFPMGATLIQFNGYSELVPVPEPGPIVGAVALLGLAACRERKRLAALLARRR